MKPRSIVAGCLLAWGCDAGLSDRERFLLAQNPNIDLAAAQAHCAAMVDPAEADACQMAMADRQQESGAEPCTQLRTEEAVAECWFRQAERHAEADERWLALAACGRAGPFTNECLYHAWTRELQALARRTDELEQALAMAEEPIAYWSQLETAGPDQRERVWGDFWNFWWLHHPPASLAPCGELPPELTQACERGTRFFVERSVDQALRDPAQASLLDRACRAGQLPEFLPGAAARPEPQLLAAGLLALERLCTQGIEAARPWNPVFQPRRPR